MVIGDNYNDIFMLCYAGYGVVMVNVDDIVKFYVCSFCLIDNNYVGFV